MSWLRKIFGRANNIPPSRPHATVPVAPASAEPVLGEAEAALPEAEATPTVETAQQIFERLPHGEKQRVQEIVKTIITHIQRDEEIPGFHVNDSFSVDARDCLMAFAKEYGLSAKWNSEAGNTITFARST